MEGISSYVNKHVSLIWILELCSVLGLTLATEYGVVIDAGSSGSRVRLYQWSKRTSPDRLPVFNEFFSKKVEPGISDFKGDKLDGLEDYLKLLVEAATGEIPGDHIKDTSLFLMATAGRALTNRALTCPLIACGLT